MNKGIFNLWRFVEVGEQANRRYLDALANVQAKSQAVDELDALCLSRVVDGVRRPRFNPVAPEDYRLFLAVLAGEHMIRGFRSRDLRERIFPPTVDPVELGLEPCEPKELLGGTAAENAQMLREVLGGAKGPLRDVVLLNAAAVLVVAGAARDLKDGLAKAAKSVDSGAALKKLDKLVKLTKTR